MATEPDDIPAAQLRTMQIIAAAMMMGIMFALAIFVFLALVQQKKTISTQLDDLQPLSLIALVVLATNASLSFVLPGTVARNALRQVAAGAQPLDSLLPLRQTTLIIGLALLEGAAMLGCIAFFIDCHAVDLAVVILLLAIMLSRFPTRARVRTWLARQLAFLEELRLEGS